MPLSASAIRGIFARSGAASQRTRLFDDVPAQIATSVLAVTRTLEAKVEPVLLTWRSESDWLLITPTQLVISTRGTVRLVPVSTIVRVEPVKTDAGSNRPLPKNAMSELRLTQNTGASIVVDADCGRAFVGIWNVIASMEAANRERASRE
jgi:hypothetical protein